MFLSTSHLIVKLFQPNDIFDLRLKPPPAFQTISKAFL